MILTTTPANPTHANQGARVFIHWGSVSNIVEK